MTRLETITQAISGRRGSENAISAPEISRETGIPERTVRRLIAAAPDFQPLGCAGKGYYIPTSVDEIHAKDQNLADQEKAIRRRRKLFRAFWHKQGIGFPSKV